MSLGTTVNRGARTFLGSCAALSIKTLLTLLARANVNLEAIGDRTGWRSAFARERNLRASNRFADLRFHSLALEPIVISLYLAQSISEALLGIAASALILCFGEGFACTVRATRHCLKAHQNQGSFSILVYHVAQVQRLRTRCMQVTGCTIDFKIDIRGQLVSGTKTGQGVKCYFVGI